MSLSRSQLQAKTTGLAFPRLRSVMRDRGVLRTEGPGVSKVDCLRLPLNSSQILTLGLPNLPHTHRNAQWWPVLPSCGSHLLRMPVTKNLSG